MPQPKTHLNPTDALDAVRVLIVDDNKGNCQLLSRLIGSLGISRIEVAHDGFEGLEAARRFQPNLILLDVLMPNMDGFEMCRQLRREFPRSSLPVLFVTALDNPAERADCFAAGGTDMVSKPINPAEIIARVGVHLENRLLLARLQAYQDRVEHELSSARQAQLDLQPDIEDLKRIGAEHRVKIDGVMKTSSELGGDFWSVWPGGPDQLCLLVADFTGHGVAAALNVFRLQSMIGRMAGRVATPTGILSDLNRELHRLLSIGQFAAAACMVLDTRTGLLTYANAAAPLPVLLCDGQARYLDTAGPPLGAFADAVFDEESVTMPQGALVVAYSDALTESEIDGCPVIDESALLTHIETLSATPCPACALADHFQSRLPGAPPDDLTIVSLRRL